MRFSKNRFFLITMNLTFLFFNFLWLIKTGSRTVLVLQVIALLFAYGYGLGSALVRIINPSAFEIYSVERIILGLCCVAISLNWTSFFGWTLSKVLFHVIGTFLFGLGVCELYQMRSELKMKAEVLLASKEGVLFVACLSFAAYIFYYGIRDHFFPALHDPVSLSLTAKQFVADGYTLKSVPDLQRLYPNGLGWLTALGITHFKTESALILLYLAASFNVLYLCSLYVFGLSLFEDRIAAAITAITGVFLTNLPSSQIFVQALYAHLVAISFMLVAAAITLRIAKKYSKAVEQEMTALMVLLGTVCGGSQYFHYNSLPFFVPFLGVLGVKLVTSRQSATARIKQSLVFGCVLVFALIPNVVRLLENPKVIKRDAETQVIVPSSLVDGLHTAIVEFYKHWRIAILNPPFRLISIIGLLAIVGGMFSRRIRKNIPGLEQSFAPILGVLVWTLFAISHLAEKYRLFFINSHYFKRLIFVSCILAFTLSFLILLQGAKWLSEKLRTSQLSGLFGRVPVTFLATLPPLLLWTLFLGNAIKHGFSIHQKLYESRQEVAVAPSDLKAYKWINQNPQIIQGGHFISRVTLEGVPSILDGALYIPYFTPYEVYLSWTPTHHFYRGIPADQELYRRFVANLGDPEALSQLKEKGIRFIYFSERSPWAEVFPLNPEVISRYPQLYTKVYEMDKSSIWKIL